MATMKLEFSEPLNVPGDELVIPSTTATKKEPDSQAVIKKRMAEAASKKAQIPEPNKKPRKKWAEEALAPLIAQLPVNPQQAAAVEKLMTFCQSGLGIEKLSFPEGNQSDAKFAMVDSLTSEPFDISERILSSLQGHKLKAQPQKSLNGKNTVTMMADTVPKTSHVMAKSTVIDNDGMHESLPAKRVMDPASVNVSSTQPLNLSRNKLKVEEGEKQVNSFASQDQQPVSTPSNVIATHSPVELDTDNIGGDPMMPSPLKNADIKQSTINPSQPQNIADEPIVSQPIQADVLDGSQESPDALVLQNSSAQASTSSNAMVSTGAQPRQPTQSLNKMAEAIAKNAAPTADSVAKVEGRSLTYTFNQWQNNPSVTFELAARGSELLASTTSPEVHRALHDNQHLFRGEQSLFIRQDEQRHERQRQQQQQQEQPEQEDN